MGIEAAILGGAAVNTIGNIIGGQSQASSASKAEQGIQDRFEQSLALGQPYREAGQQALSEYQGLMTPEGQSQFYEDYMSSPMFETERKAREEAYARAQSAMGGLRTGQANVAFGNIAPQLAAQGYGQRLQGLQNLTNLGASVSGQGASSAMQAGMAQAPYTAQAAGAQGQALAGTLGNLGGLLMYSGMQPQTSTIAAPGQGWGLPSDYAGLA